ncbi:MAG: family 43 glycosylhydrolase [Treponema sp.]|jgi:arabinoxylan arabinofuranohydrolase|nr:family 43 glycosylhydrolase [Treponema sp.]
MKIKIIILPLILFLTLFTSCFTSSGLNSRSSPALVKAYKSLTHRNPVITHTFGADPCVLVYNDRVYIYLTGDTLEHDSNGTVKSNSYSTINTLRVISSADLANWTYHEPIQVAGWEGIAGWANNSWAPDITYKQVNGKDKFFLYFSNNANGVGVLTADNPLGPWTDPLGYPLVSRQTANCDIPWVFDPAVLIDDDGKGYLYFGGGVPAGKEANPGTARVVALGDDMISLAGDPILIDAPFFFEAAGINKLNGRYIFSYCTNWNVKDATGRKHGLDNAVIAMMSSDNPLGPFTIEGTVMRNPGSFFNIWGNNHHTIFEFRDKWYITYHTQILENRMGIQRKGYRAPHIDSVTVKNGKFEKVTATLRGVEQTGKLNPYSRQKGATSGISAGLTFASENAVIQKEGAWLGIFGADFGEAGADSLTINARAKEESQIFTIEIRLGLPTGNVIGTYKGSLTPAFANYTVQLTQTVGNIHDVYFIFHESGMDFGGWQFN